MRLVVFDATNEYIRECLHIPDDCYIANITRHDWNNDTFKIYVTIPGEPGPEGALPLQIMPILTRNKDDSIFWNWNLPKDKE